MIGIDVDHRAASRMLEGITDRVEDPRPALRVIGDDLVERERERFATGGRWRKLSAATIRAKGHGRRLVDSGNLMRSLTTSSAITVTDDYVEISTDVWPAKLLRSGTKHMPARNPVPGASKKERVDWTDVMARAMVGGSR